MVRRQFWATLQNVSAQVYAALLIKMELEMQSIKKQSGALPLIVIILIAVFLGGALGMGGAFWLDIQTGADRNDCLETHAQKMYACGFGLEQGLHNLADKCAQKSTKELMACLKKAGPF